MSGVPPALASAHATERRFFQPPESVSAGTSMRASSNPILPRMTCASTSASCWSPWVSAHCMAEAVQAESGVAPAANSSRCGT